ncbi:MAG TPA: HEAT repeat domain-containing protein [Pyrinomonadaceae bacterium]|nr:HEAT repeat domain-containing protein [Pyrinomonadaceae bacterium]
MDPETRTASRANRMRASGPILILAALFVAATFLAWYFTWFGRGLSDEDISKYLSDTKNPRHVQHALLQVQQRMERGDPSARNWYPQIQSLSTSPETEFRLTAAWLMGFDNHYVEFHSSLLNLVKDNEPIVRRNAALALVRFNDDHGHDELIAVLRPYAVKANASGTVSSTLHAGSEVSRGTLLGRIQSADSKVDELRSPLPGKINQILKGNGVQVNTGEDVLTLNSDEESVWEALRGLSLVGTRADLSLIESYAESKTVSARVMEQARLTAEVIRGR